MLSKIKYLLPLVLLLPLYFLVDKGAEAESEQPQIQVANCKELFDVDLSQNNNRFANIIISENMDCGGAVVKPIGSKDIPFSGTLSCGKASPPCVISNARFFTDPSNKRGLAGLFAALAPYTDPNQGITYYPVVRDITVLNSITQTTDDSHKGIIAGSATDADIINVIVENSEVLQHVDSSIVPSSSAGGIVGNAHNTRICNVHLKTITVERPLRAGGIVGRATNGTQVYYSSVYGLGARSAEACNPAGQAYGGLIGIVEAEGNSPDALVKISKSSVDKHGINNCLDSGGLVGSVQPEIRLEIDNSYSNLPIEARKDTSGNWENDFAGGLIGHVYEGDGSCKGIYYDKVYASARVELGKGNGGRKMVGSPHNASNCVHRLVTDSSNKPDSYWDVGEQDNDKPSGDSFSMGLTDYDLRVSPGYGTYLGMWSREIWIFQHTSGNWPLLISTENFKDSTAVNYCNNLPQRTAMSTIEQ